MAYCRRVQQHVNGATTHKPGSGSHHAVGAYRQALHGAMQAELADFYRLMAVLEAHATQPIPLPGKISEFYSMTAISCIEAKTGSLYLHVKLCRHLDYTMGVL